METNKAQRLRESWKKIKQVKEEKSKQFRESASRECLVRPLTTHVDSTTTTIEEGIKARVEAEPYWFQKIEIFPGYFSPGWSDPVSEKLPFFGLPEDLSGMRVLDIGCAEGFFSFEAEKRGAREVIAIDSFPDSIRRFHMVKEARQSSATAFLTNVYDLDPNKLGTFDLVLFYGVFYHLKHPQVALEKIMSVCRGDLLFQTCICEEESIRDEPWAKYHPHGLLSGANKELYDPTIFWLFNSACCIAMLDGVGFEDISIVSDQPHPFVARATSPHPGNGEPPDQTLSPWS